MDLNTLLVKAEDWAKLKTEVPGMFVQKLAATKAGAPARLAMWLNPVDASGATTKRHGIVVRGDVDLEALRVLINHPLAAKLLGRIVAENLEVNGEAPMVIGVGTESVLKI